MPRLRSALSGAVMTVEDSTAALLGSEWVDAESPARPEGAPSTSWKVADLKAHAEENGIDLGDATKKEDIVAAITAATTSAE